ncbi:hypothetical protein [Haloarchaeobius amylolyticus]|uniref:hypothetical protein n=1 Tax=Haloarchaeobius amylolyticus TaxID=1198296 RepID=UPI0022714005|nr:hypothetical protein [Haloarchaeobius amylolyticus]
MEKLTLLEIHLNDEVSFSNVVGGDADEAEAATDGGTAEVAADAAAESRSESDAEADEAESGGPNPLLLLAGFVALVLVAVGVRKLVGGDADEEFEPEMVDLEADE